MSNGPASAAHTPQPHTLGSSREDLICLLVLAALVVVAARAVFFFGYLPLQTDPGTLAAQGVVRATDEALSIYPAYRFIEDATRHGESLLWNPLEYSGAPFFAAWKTRCISPFTIPFFIFSFDTALRLSLLLKLLVAGLSTYFVARRLGLAPALALFAATSYALGAAFTVSPAHPAADAAPWYPLLYLFAERIALGQFRYWPAAAGVLSAVLLGGYISAALVAVPAIFLFVLLRTARGNASKRLALAGAAVSVIVGFGIAAVQIIPYLEYVQNTVPRETSVAPHFEWASYTALAFPHLTQAWTQDYRSALSLHIGLVPLAVAFFWLLVRRGEREPARKRVDAAFATAALLLVATIALSWPASGVGPQDLLPLAALLTALGSALVADLWLKLNAEDTTAALGRVLVAVPLTLGLIALLLAVIRQLGFASTGEVLKQGFYTSAFLFAVALLISTTAVRPSARLMGYALTALTAANLLTAFAPAEHFSHPRDVSPTAHLARNLPRDTGRVTGSAALARWPLAPLGIAQTRGTSLRPMRGYRDYLDDASNDAAAAALPGSGYLLATLGDHRDGKFASMRDRLRVLEVSEDGTIIYEILDPAPRVQFIPENESANPNARVTRDSNTHIEVAIQDHRAGTLVLYDAYAPGWRALVDGRPTQVEDVEGAFRGVEVPAGTSMVVFDYAPKSLAFGLRITLAALAVTALGFVNLLRLREKHPQTSS